MDKDTSIRVSVGTVAQALNYAKVTGKLCLKELYLLNIVNRFLNDCPDCISECDREKLEKLARDIQNKTGYICKYRGTPDNFGMKFKNKNINNFFGEMATFNLNITGQVNNPPSQVGDGAKTTEHATAVTLTVADLTVNLVPPYADPEGDAAELLKILSLPADGVLQLNGVDCTVNQIINFSDIMAGQFKYIPNPANTSTRIVPFTFAIADAGSLTFTS